MKDIIKSIIDKLSIDSIADFIDEHKGVILTGSTIIFTISGIAVTYRNSPKIHELVDGCMERLQNCDPADVETKRGIVIVTLREVAPLAFPIIFFATGASACAIINQHDHDVKLAATMTVASAAISKYDTFTQEAKKVLGEEKFKEIQTEVNKAEARKEIVKNPNVINPGSGKEICYVPYFGKYFANTEDGIDLAMLRVNQVLDKNRIGGKSYGHESKYGREIVTGEDLLCELGLDIREIPDIAKMVGWEAGRVDEIRYNVIRDEMNGMSYLILNLHTMPCNIKD